MAHIDAPAHPRTPSNAIEGDQRGTSNTAGRTAYTPAEVAQMIGCTAKGVRLMVARGDIKGVKIGRRMVRIPAEELARLNILPEGGDLR